MASYPLPDLAAHFAPLPLYNQAAPPLFNLLMSLLAPLPPVAVRLVLGAINLGGMLWLMRVLRPGAGMGGQAAGSPGRATRRAETGAGAGRHPAGPDGAPPGHHNGHHFDDQAGDPGRWYLPVATAALLFSAYLVFYATEMKYYGLETLGTTAVLCWLAGKPLSQPFGARDAALLAAAALCGIATLVVAAAGAAVFAALARLQGGAPAGAGGAGPSAPCDGQPPGPLPSATHSVPRPSSPAPPAIAARDGAAGPVPRGRAAATPAGSGPASPSSGRRLAGREWAALAGLGLFLGLYALLIRRMIALQVDSFPEAYEARGLGAVRELVSAMVTYARPPGLLALAALALLCLALWHEERTRRILALTLACGAGFAGLAFLGQFPASAPRHVAFAGGFAAVIAIHAVLGGLALRRPARRRAVAGLAILLLAGTALAATLQRMPGFAAGMTENDRLMAWLAAAPPADVGLWHGAQPVLDYYRRHQPGLDRHRYFGLVNPESRVLPEALRAPVRLATTQIPLWIEARRREPGGWVRRSAYMGLLRDMTGAARALVAEAPRGQPFLILASHLRSLREMQPGVLEGALAEAGCQVTLALEVRDGQILRATCPPP